MRYFFIEADREDRTWVQRLATFVPLDIDVVDLHVLRFQLIDDGTDVPERMELHVQIDVTRVLLYVRIHNWEQADAEKYHRECDEHALVKSCADRGEQVKVLNLRVLKVIPESNLILVKGSIPGAKGAYLTIEK